MSIVVNVPDSSVIDVAVSRPGQTLKFVRKLYNTIRNVFIRNESKDDLDNIANIVDQSFVQQLSPYLTNRELLDTISNSATVAYSIIFDNNNPINPLEAINKASADGVLASEFANRNFNGIIVQSATIISSSAFGSSTSISLPDNTSSNNDKRLSVGAIVGIAIGSAAVVGLIIFGVFYSFRMSFNSSNNYNNISSQKIPSKYLTNLANRDGIMMREEGRADLLVGDEIPSVSVGNSSTKSQYMIPQDPYSTQSSQVRNDHFANVI